MAANENNSQVNTFVKGMNSDMSYSMLPEGQYTYAENIRITALGSGAIENGQGAVRPIEGIRWVSQHVNIKDVLATDTIRNYGIIIYTNIPEDDEDPTWHVGRFDSNTETFVKIFDSGEKPTVDKFSIVTHYETDELIKLYIADGVNPIKMLNIVDPVIIQGNLIDPHKVESYPRVIFQPMDFMGLIDGTLKSGMVQYAYQLYNKHGIATDISPTTNLIPIINKNTLSGYAEGKTTNCGVNVGTIYQTENGYFDRVRIYRIHYTENGQLPTIEVIEDTNISCFDTIPWGEHGENAKFINIKDTGQSALSTITLEEFNSLSGMHIIPKVIEDKNDYLFAAAIKDVQQSSFDGIENVQASFEIVSMDLIGDASKAVGAGVIRHNTIKRISNDSSWNLGDIETQDPDFSDLLHRMITDNNYSYSNPLISYYAKSLRRGEVYRFGIVFYNEKGESSGVVCITDIDLGSPEYEAFIPYQFSTSQYTGDYELTVHPIGLKITVSNIPESAVAYEIVRCRRTLQDTRNISQGVISKPVKKIDYEKITEGQDVSYVKDTEYPYTPSGFLTVTDLSYTTKYRLSTPISSEEFPLNIPGITDNYFRCATNIGESHILQFVSPEVSYTKDSFLSAVKDNNLKLVPIISLYCDSGKQASLPQATGTTIHGRFYPAYNNTSLEFCPTFWGNDTYTPSLCICGKNYPSTFYRIQPTQGELNNTSIDAVNTGGNWSYIPLTELDLDDPNAEDRDGLQGKTVKYIKQKSNSYIKLYNTFYNYENDIEVSDIIVSNELGWNDVFEGGKGEEPVVNKYEDYLQVVGTNTFNNVIAGGWYGLDIKHFLNTDSRINEYEGDRDDDYLFFGLGGRCAVLNTKNPVPFETSTNYTNNRYFYTVLCNLHQDITPYGGSSTEARKLNTFYSYGDYHLVNGLTQRESVSFIGDTYIEPFEYVSMHKMYFPTASDTLASHMIAYSIPVETSINLAYTHGNELSKNYTDSGITNVQVEPASVYNVYNQKEPLYAYNTVYSNNTTARLFAVRDDEDDLSIQDNMDYRVYHSNLKENGEYIDNWLKFQPSNYLDADSQYGPITHMRNFHDKLIFWQQSAMGLFSVNERTLTTDDSNLPLILGTGGVLTRYDYIDNTAGMKEEQYCDTMSDSTLYWYDDHNNEIKAYQNGTGVLSLTKQFGVQNLMHNHDDNNKPWMFYDKKYNEVVLDFAQETKKSIVFNEQVKAFTSIYTVGFDGALTFKDGIYMLDLNGDDMQIGKWDEGDVTDFYDNKLKTKIVYVVNKNPLTTKVFDNQELGSYYRNDVFTDDSYFYLNHVYKWKSDLNETLNIYDLPMTTREGNYRFAIPRADGRNWGNRIRGKYMICSIEDRNPNKDVSLSYILTKFRTSWS